MASLPAFVRRLPLDLIANVCKYCDDVFALLKTNYDEFTILAMLFSLSMRWITAPGEKPRMKDVLYNESSNHSANDIENPCSIKTKLDKLSPLSSNCCIYKVPMRLRKQNEKAYTPQVVSIGPIHHGQKHLEAMEDHKLRSVKMFLEWTNMSLEDAVEFIKEREVRLRNAYSEPIMLSSNEFVDIILVDAIFIVVVLVNKVLPQTRGKEDRLYGKERLINDVFIDLLMLENQVPFFVLDDLLAKAKDVFTELEEWISLSGLVNYICRVSILIREVPLKKDSGDIRHIVDCIRTYHLPLELLIKEEKYSSNFNHSLTKLHEAGVVLKVASSNYLMDIKFNNGVLEIPHIMIDDRTENILRNIVAFEQCHCHGSGMYITDYVCLMDLLINTQKDVELLVKYGIVENNLSDSQEVTTLFNNLCKDVTYDPNSFYFGDICEQLNEHCQVKCNKWMASLKHEYFKNPWKILSIIAAIILLILTVIQTVCSVISVS